MKGIRNITIDDCVEVLLRHCTYPHPEVMRTLVSTTEIIQKIETQCVLHIIEELKELKTDG